MILVCLQKSESFNDGFKENPVLSAVQPCVGQKRVYSLGF